MLHYVSPCVHHMHLKLQGWAAKFTNVFVSELLLDLSIEMKLRHLRIDLPAAKDQSKHCHDGGVQRAEDT